MTPRSPWPAPPRARATTSTTSSCGCSTRRATRLRQDVGVPEPVRTVAHALPRLPPGARGRLERRRLRGPRRAPRRRRRRDRRPRHPHHPLRSQRPAVRRPRALPRRRGLGEGRDRQRLRLAQGAAPVRDACSNSRWRRARLEAAGAAPARATRRWPSPPAATPRWLPRSSRVPPGRPLDVFIPSDADPVVVERLRDLGAASPCASASRASPATRPTSRLLRAIGAGSVPFTCQGNLNGLAIEGGETLGWEMASAVGSAGGPARLDRVVVQVGGGALLASGARGACGTAARPCRGSTPSSRAAVHPLARAFERVRGAGGGGRAGSTRSLADAARHRSAFMWPWEPEPHSVAHGIVDDETYDWRACVEGLLASGGGPVIATRRRSRRPTPWPGRRPASTSITPGRPGWPGCSSWRDPSHSAPTRTSRSSSPAPCGARRRRRPATSTPTSGAI